jgi:hypothetical protein
MKHNSFGYGFVAEKSAGSFPPWQKDRKIAVNSSKEFDRNEL